MSEEENLNEKDPNQDSTPNPESKTSCTGRLGRSSVDTGPLLPASPIPHSGNSILTFLWGITGCPFYVPAASGVDMSVMFQPQCQSQGWARNQVRLTRAVSTVLGLHTHLRKEALSAEAANLEGHKETHLRREPTQNNVEQRWRETEY